MQRATGTTIYVLRRGTITYWVNCISRKHQSPSIDRFRICFNLDKNAKGAITKWIEFAISKNVQTLELDLRDNDTKFGNYVFPDKILIGNVDLH